MENAFLLQVIFTSMAAFSWHLMNLFFGSSWKRRVLTVSCCCCWQHGCWRGERSDGVRRSKGRAAGAGWRAARTGGHGRWQTRLILSDNMYSSSSSVKSAWSAYLWFRLRIERGLIIGIGRNRGRGRAGRGWCRTLHWAVQSEECEAALAANFQVFKKVNYLKCKA